MKTWTQLLLVLGVICTGTMAQSDDTGRTIDAFRRTCMSAATEGFRRTMGDRVPVVAMAIVTDELARVVAGMDPSQIRRGSGVLSPFGEQIEAFNESLTVRIGDRGSLVGFGFQLSPDMRNAMRTAAGIADGAPLLSVEEVSARYREWVDGYLGDDWIVKIENTDMHSDGVAFVRASQYSADGRFRVLYRQVTVKIDMVTGWVVGLDDQRSRSLPPHLPEKVITEKEAVAIVEKSGFLIEGERIGDELGHKLYLFERASGTKKADQLKNPNWRLVWLVTSLRPAKLRKIRGPDGGSFDYQPHRPCSFGVDAITGEILDDQADTWL